MMNIWNETLSTLAPPVPAASPAAPATSTATAAMAMIATAATAVTGTVGVVETAGAAGVATAAQPAASAGITTPTATAAPAGAATPTATAALTDAGAAAAGDAMRSYTDFGRALTTADLADGFVAPVGNLGLIAVTGADAASFLQGQLTNDVATLSAGTVRLAGYCTPKGRLQATMTMWRTAAAVAEPAPAATAPAPSAQAAAPAGAIYLQLPRPMQAAFQKRLSMFVMRAKAKLIDVTDEPQHAAVIGLGGARAGAALLAHVGTLPPAPNTVVMHGNGTVLRLADAFGAPRYLWLTSADSAVAALPALRATLALGGTDAWELSGIHAGIAQVTSATIEQFVPQMINFELIGGVSFKKGCYPGQEIVARSQYLGKLKRRTTLATIADPAAAAGMELFAEDDPAQPCGMIVNAAPNGAGGVDALVEMKLGALDQAVHTGSTTGARLEFLAMPYALDALDL
jgi:folate-binding protein YgfZ